MSTTNESCSPKNGSFSWNELIATDTTGANDFYCKLFDWHSAPFAPQGAPAGDSSYMLFKRNADDEAVGGMVKPMNADVPAHWVPYIIVDDVDESVARASELGAAIMVPVMPVPEVGRIAILKDPAGASFGLHELPKKA